MRKLTKKSRIRQFRPINSLVESLEQRLVMDGAVGLQSSDAENTFTIQVAETITVLTAPVLEEGSENHESTLELESEEEVDQVLECGILPNLSLGEENTVDESALVSTESTSDGDGASDGEESSNSEDSDATSCDDGGIISLSGTGEEGISGSSGGITLQRLDSAEDVADLLLTEATNRYGGWFGQPVWTGVWDYVLLGGPGVDRLESVDRNTIQLAADHSSTNVQVAGVDEGDLVETDGSFIFIARQNELVVVDVRDPTAHDVVFTSPITDEGTYGQIQALVLHENRLTVISSVYGQVAVGDAVGLIRPLWMPVVQRTQVTVFDLEDPESPVVVDRAVLDGSLIASRSVGSNVYLVLSNTVNLPVPKTVCEPVDPNESDDSGSLNGVDRRAVPDVGILPWLRHESFQTCRYETRDDYVARVSAEILQLALPRIQHGDQTSFLSAPESIYWDLNHESYQLLSVVRVDSSSEHASPETSVTLELNQSSQVYASQENLYVFGTWHSERGANTTITKFSFSDGDSPIDLVAQGSVPGILLNQFSADEYQGALRIATTTWQLESVNGIYVLEQDEDSLEIVGQIDGIAPGERIFSARFMGDVGHLVTFRQIDPLFSLDLSDPKNPRVTGELKVPGFSNYLHPVPGNKLIGVGQDTDRGNWLGQSLLVSLFDVADPAAPTSVDRFTVDGYSNGQFDHHSIGYFEDVQILALPVSTYDWVPSIMRCFVVDSVGNCHGSEPDVQHDRHKLLLLKIDPSAAEDSIQLLASIGSESPLLRSLKIGDRIFAIGSDDIFSVNLADPSGPPVRGVIGGVANPDWYRFERSDSEQTLEVLSNDRVNLVGGLENWKIVETTTPSGGGTVSIAADGHSLLYTTPSNQDVAFEDCEYVIESIAGQKHRGRVSIGIHDRRVEVPDDQQETGREMAELARGRLAELLNVDAREIQVLHIRFVEWPDSCLGARTDEVCLTVVTPKFMVILGHDGSRYEFHTDTQDLLVLIENVTETPGPMDDLFSVEIDSENNQLDVLAHDFPGVSFIRPPQITAVSVADQGGTVTVTADGFSLIYAPQKGFRGVEKFSYTVDGGATANVVVDVTAIEDAVEIRLELSDLEGNPISAVTVGETFVLNVFVKDVREVDSELKGVFASYLDLIYNDRLARVAAEATFGDLFPNGQSGNFSIPGVIDDLGAFTAELKAGETGEALLASLEFTATNIGRLEFKSAQAGNTPGTDVLVFGENLGVEIGAIDFSGVDIEVVDTYHNSVNSFDVNGDGHTSPIDVLILFDEINQHGARKLSHIYRESGEGETRGRPFYFDPNRDGYLSPVDVVMVVNLLNETFDSNRAQDGSPNTSTDQVPPVLDQSVDNSGANRPGRDGSNSPPSNGTNNSNTIGAGRIANSPLSAEQVRRVFGRFGRRSVNSILEDLADVETESRDPQEVLDEVFGRIGRTGG